MNQIEWEKEFEEKFYLVGTDERDLDGQGTRDEIKDFIRETIAKAETDAKRETYQDAKARVPLGMFMDGGKYYNEDFVKGFHDCRDAVNSSLDERIKALTNQK